MEHTLPIIKIEYIESPSNIKVEQEEYYVKSETVAEEFILKDFEERSYNVHHALVYFQIQ